MWHWREYLVPTLASVLFHALLLYGLYRGFGFVSNTELQVFKPTSINTSLVVLPQRQRRVPATPNLSDAGAPPVANEPQQNSTEATQEDSAESEIERELREQQERRQRLEELRDRAFRDAISRETVELTSDAVDDESQLYVSAIYQSVVDNWSRPLSARKGMTAILLVELFPTGELNSVGILDSSGDLAFDRSAERAVRKAAPFIVPQESAVFESRFRNITLKFTPEDLLR